LANHLYWTCILILSIEALVSTNSPSDYIVSGTFFQKNKYLILVPKREQEGDAFGPEDGEGKPPPEKKRRW
jgi:hypothetical protein